jgi:hypothetical protein
MPNNCSWEDLCLRLKSTIDQDNGYDLSFIIYQNPYSRIKAIEVYEDSREPRLVPPPFSVVNAFTQQSYHLRVLQPMGRGMRDIGEFVLAEQSSNTLVPSLCSQESFSHDELQKLIEALGRNRTLTHNFLWISRVKGLTDQALCKMKDYCDNIHSEEGSNASGLDLQIPISREQLLDFVGDLCVQELDGLFGKKCEDMVLRRCDKKDHCIDFHVDYAHKTMQVTLVDEAEYDGGRLVFVSKEGKLEQPTREAGSATLHDGGVIHGVTALRGGVRYGLLVLDRSVSISV